MHGSIPLHFSLPKDARPEQLIGAPTGLAFRGLYLVSSRLLSPCMFFLSRGDYSPTATTAPSLKLLVASSSLISCRPVQVYYHHPWLTVPLDPVFQ
jgi:hypothetical protein